MPECLKTLLTKLTLKESDNVWQWLDECPDAVEQMISTVADKVNRTDLGDFSG